METNVQPNPKLSVALTAILLLAALVVIGRPAISGAQDTSQRLYFVHDNTRLLDTRSGVKPSNGWETTVALDPTYTSVKDWQINVQVVQAAGDGWIEVDGQSAVVYDSGRANVVTSVAGDGAGVDVQLHGSSAHIIIDLVRVITDVDPSPPADPGDGDGGS